MPQHDEHRDERRPSSGDDDHRAEAQAGHPNEETQERLAEEGSSLRADELREIGERAKLRPLALYEIVRQEGESELSRPASSLWWSGVAAGVSIGFSLYAEAAMRAHLPDANWRPLVENWGYSVGFLIVILGRQQLFTEITLTATLPVLARPRIRNTLALFRLWAIVLFANLVGTALFAAAMALEFMNDPEVTRAAVAISREAVEANATQTFFRAIAAGWLMATVVWVMPSSEAFGFFVIALLTYLIALFGLSHIVAGSVEAFLLVFRGDARLLDALIGFQLPALIGNILGGAALFSLISYGQVAQEMEEAESGGRR